MLPPYCNSERFVAHDHDALHAASGKVIGHYPVLRTAVVPHCYGVLTLSKATCEVGRFYVAVENAKERRMDQQSGNSFWSAPSVFHKLSAVVS